MSSRTGGRPPLAGRRRDLDEDAALDQSPDDVGHGRGAESALTGEIRTRDRTRLTHELDQEAAVEVAQQARASRAAARSRRWRSRPCRQLRPAWAQPRPPPLVELSSWSFSPHATSRSIYAARLTFVSDHTKSKVTMSTAINSYLASRGPARGSADYAARKEPSVRNTLTRPRSPASASATGGSVSRPSRSAKNM